MMLRKKKILSSVMSMILVLTTTSCSASTEQEASRSVRSSSIDTYSETSESVETSIAESETTYAWAGEEKDKPQEFGFELTFSDDLKVFDYGRKTLNLYWGILDENTCLTASFLDEWMKYSNEYTSLVDWSVGQEVFVEEVSGEIVNVQYTDYDMVKHNMQNVDLLKLSEVEEGEKLVETLGIDPDSEILCWEYQVVDFPVEDVSKSFNDVPVHFERFEDVHTVRNAQIPPYVDGVPVHIVQNNFCYCTFDWPEMIEPSAYSSSVIARRLVNPSCTCCMSVPLDKWSTTEVIQADLPIIQPEACLDGIANTMKYQPTAFSNGTRGFSDVWGKEVEVYCMNLTYVGLNPHPPKTDGEKDDSVSSYQMYLVPAWEVYYTCTDPESKAIIRGNLVINAVTGESLFSTTIAQGENEELYPDMHSI